MNDIQEGAYLDFYESTHPAESDICRCGLPVEIGPYCPDCKSEIDDANGKYDPR